MGNVGFVCNNFCLHIYSLLSENLSVTKNFTMKQTVKYLMLVKITKCCNTVVFRILVITVNYFRKTLYLRCLAGFWILLCNKYNIFEMGSFIKTFCCLLFLFEYVFKTDILKVYEGKPTKIIWQKKPFVFVLQKNRS